MKKLVIRFNAPVVLLFALLSLLVLLLDCLLYTSDAADE